MQSIENTIFLPLIWRSPIYEYLKKSDKSHCLETLLSSNIFILECPCRWLLHAVCVPPEFICWKFNPSVLLEDGAFWRWLGREGGALMNGTNPLVKETSESSLTSSIKWGHNKRQVSMNQADSDRQEISVLILDFPVSKTMRNNFYCLKAPILW